MELGLARRLEAEVDYDLGKDVETRILLNAGYVAMTPGAHHEARR